MKPTLVSWSGSAGRRPACGESRGRPSDLQSLRGAAGPDEDGERCSDGPGPTAGDADEDTGPAEELWTDRLQDQTVRSDGRRHDLLNTHKNTHTTS